MDNIRERLFTKDYILIMFSSIVFAMMNVFFLTVVPLYIVRIGGLTVHSGLLLMVFSAAALVFRPVAGILTDRFGRVKLLIIGALGSAVTCVLFGVVGTIPLLMLVRGFNGMSFSISSTCSGAAIADVIPKSRLGEGLGYFSLYTTISQAVGPAIVLFMIAGDTLGEYRTLFFSVAGFCVLSAITNCFITYERKAKKNAGGDKAAPVARRRKEKPEYAAPVLQNAGEPLPKTLLGFEYVVFAPIVAMVLTQIGVSGLTTFVAPYARWKGFGDPKLYYTVCALGIFFSRMVFGKVVDRRGPDVVIVPSMIALIIVLILIPTANSLTMLIVLGFPLGLSQGAIFPSLNSIMFKRCSAARRGTASGAYFTAVDLGYAIGAPLLGALADARDYRYIYWASAVFVLLSLSFYLLVTSEKRFKARLSRSAQ